MFLTDRQQAISVNPTDLIHIVKTGDTSQGNPAGSSYKALISQIFELTAGCCLTAGTYSDGTVSFLNSTGGTSFTVSGLNFTGGSGNCINDLYVNNIFPCTSDIFIQPQSQGKVYFGSVSGASGFTVDLVSETLAPATRLGLNTNSPQYTVDFYSWDRRSRYYYDDKTSATLHNLILSGSSDMCLSFGAFARYVNTPGGNSLSLGLRGLTESSNTPQGNTGDTCIFSSTNSQGLNIISKNGGSNLDYIRFYAGTSVSGASYQPHIHIDGRTGTKGFMGIGSGNTSPTSLVDISGVTGYNQLRIRTPYTPSSSGDTAGGTGQICWDTNFFYVKTSAGWKRAALAW